MVNDNRNITFFIGALPQGGAERVISILTNRLIESGYIVTLILLRDRPVFYHLNERLMLYIVERETGSDSLVKNVYWLHLYMKHHNDVFISFLAQYNIVALLASCGCNNSVIVADRNDPYHWPANRGIRLIRNFLYRFADGIVLQTESNKSYFSKMVQRKAIVIPNPVDMQEKKALAINMPHKHEIINVARLMPQKNQQMLIHAFKRVLRDHPDYKLKIYGDGPLLQELVSYIKKNGLLDNVYMMGSTDDIFSRMAESEIFVLNSLFEGMPNALIEAMCIGLPCISTRVSGANELINDNVNGILVNVNDEDELVEKICMLIDEDEKRESIAKQAVLINDLLAVDRILDIWLNYINNFGK